MKHDGYRGKVSKMLFEAMEVFLSSTSCFFFFFVWKINYNFFIFFTSKNKSAVPPSLWILLSWVLQTPQPPSAPIPALCNSEIQKSLKCPRIGCGFFMMLTGPWKCGFPIIIKKELRPLLLTNVLYSVLCDFLFCLRFAVLWSGPKDVFHQKKKKSSPFFFPLISAHWLILIMWWRWWSGAVFYLQCKLAKIFLQPPAWFQFKLQNTKAKTDVCKKRKGKNVSQAPIMQIAWAHGVRFGFCWWYLWFMKWQFILISFIDETKAAMGSE